MIPIILGVFAVTFYLAIIAFFIITLWRVFEKAGQPGWAAIIPIYNLYILLKMAGKPGWWLLLYLIPIANLVVSILVNLELAKRFGKSEAFGVGMVFLAAIFYPILAFGDAHWNGPRPEYYGRGSVLDQPI